MTIPGAFALSALVFAIISGVLGTSADSKRARREGTDSAFRRGAWAAFTISGILVLFGIWGAAL
jgi:MFS-type transporter involved in bile tolerance (Atg22 family)